MKFSLGYNLKILIQWQKELAFGGGSLPRRGGMSKYFCQWEGTPPYLPTRENPERGELNLKKNEKRKWVVSKEICITSMKCKDPFSAASYVRSLPRWLYYILLVSYYSHFIHSIYLLKCFEDNYFAMMLWLEPKGEVHCKLFTVQN